MNPETWLGFRFQKWVNEKTNYIDKANPDENLAALCHESNLIKIPLMN
jgi:hypothetical protein